MKMSEWSQGRSMYFLKFFVLNGGFNARRALGGRIYRRPQVHGIRGGITRALQMAGAADIGRISLLCINFDFICSPLAFNWQGAGGQGGILGAHECRLLGDV
jgi:hypothetical protein